MTSAAQNDLMTLTGPGTAAGQVLRQHWQPAALTEEFDGERPVVPVTLLGEELVAFKNPDGSYGLLGKHCPHRGVDLCYGRLEDGGLRCPFHGWLLDAAGRCLEQPAEPADSRTHEKIRHTAYPCVEKNGIVFAYLGDGTPPDFAAHDCFLAPESHSFTFKGFMECNWLQALEVGIDPAHASYLHRYLEDDDPDAGYGLQFRDWTADSDLPMTRILRDFPRPEIRVEQTAYGLRIIALRNLDNRGMHVRVTNQVFPQAIVIPMSNDMTITQWHVPVDDRHCYWYAMFTSYGDAVDKALMRKQRLELYTLPDYRPRINKSNNYGFDAAEQRSRTYTGMGPDINVHDQWAVESPGAIHDRSRENLATSDVAIMAYRRLLSAAARRTRDGKNGDGTEPSGGEKAAPIAIDAIGPVEGWENSWLERARQRRAQASWA